MPYRNAHLYLTTLFALALVAFWSAYVSQLSSAPTTFHLHGLTAGLWLLLLIAQSLTNTRNERALHRTFGMASLRGIVGGDVMHVLR